MNLHRKRRTARLSALFIIALERCCCNDKHGGAGEGDEPNQVETLWTASSMERNIAYIGIAMLVISIMAIVSYSVGILDMEMATPMNAGILFVGSFWADNYLWTSVQEVGWSGDFIFLIPMSGVAMMAIHGLFSKEMETTE